MYITSIHKCSFTLKTYYNVLHMDNTDFEANILGKSLKYMAGNSRQDCLKIYIYTLMIYLSLKLLPINILINMKT